MKGHRSGKMTFLHFPFHSLDHFGVTAKPGTWGLRGRYKIIWAPADRIVIHAHLWYNLISRYITIRGLLYCKWCILAFCSGLTTYSAWLYFVGLARRNKTQIAPDFLEDRAAMVQEFPFSWQITIRRGIHGETWARDSGLRYELIGRNSDCRSSRSPALAGASHIFCLQTLTHGSWLRCWN